MKNVILYSTGCPKCKVLSSKLDTCHINYEVCTDVDKMISIGISSVPVLSVDGKLYTFSEAINFVNSKQ